MNNDENLRNNILEALSALPTWDTSGIAVSVHNGTATLSGMIESFAKKAAIENAVKKIIGLKVIIEQIAVATNSWEQQNDNEIAARVRNAFKISLNAPDDAITITVENGWVTLGGQLEWNYQKEAAKEAAGNLTGVKGVHNNIAIRSEITAEVQPETIKRALKSHAALDSKKISVSVSGKTVTLTGTVDSYSEKALAGRIAWKAPGVINVDNQLIAGDENLPK